MIRVRAAHTCAERTNPPNQDTNVYDPATGGAWYAANYIRNGTSYEFPVIEQMFSFSGGAQATMGLRRHDFNDPDGAARISAQN